MAPIEFVRLAAVIILSVATRMCLFIGRKVSGVLALLLCLPIICWLGCSAVAGLYLHFVHFADHSFVILQKHSPRHPSFSPTMFRAHRHHLLAMGFQNARAKRRIMFCKMAEDLGK
jgi:hypothetical protein